MWQEGRLEESRARSKGISGDQFVEVAKESDRGRVRSLLEGL